jgi:hypothetical protein
MKKFHILFIFLSFYFPLSITAQNSILRGFVYDALSGEPVSYASLHLQGTQQGGLTDKNGSFLITNILNGTYSVKISAMGYNDFYDTISISSSSTIVKKYTINKATYSLKTVQIIAENYRDIQETRTSVISVTPKEMSKMPSIGGQPDFAQYLQVLPGIISTGDQGGQLYIRGGAPVQNLMLLDGVTIFNPFHSIGLFSVFDTDIMSNADIYTGGFGAEFGGRISSVMDIKTRDGNKKRISGKLDMNTFGAKMLLEGPLLKLKDNRKTSLSYILSGKGSYLDKSSRIFYPYVKSELPYSYYDIYGKMSCNIVNGSFLNFFGFYFDDKMNYSSVAKYNWNNWGVGTNFLIIPGTVPTTIEGTIAYTNYITQFDENSEIYTSSRKSFINGFTANMKFNYFLDHGLLNVGFDILGFQTHYSVFGTEKDNTTDMGIFVKYKYNFRNQILIEPSFRLQSYFSLNAYSPEPRLSIKYNITKKIRLKLAGGLYSQNFVAISSDQDVVNFFYGFTSSPNMSQLPFDQRENIKKRTNPLQRAQHVVLGLELDVLKYTSINIESYYKRFLPIVSANRYQQFMELGALQDMRMVSTDFIWEIGDAYGGDISAKIEYKGFYTWIVYSLGWVTRNDGIVTYSPHYDRRHNVNILISYSFGKRRSWQADVRWNFGTGFPFTKTRGFYPLYNPSSIPNNYVTANEDLSFSLSELAQGRLPNYHRLDISIRKKFFLGERHVIDISLSATNVYNYYNIFYVNRVTNNIIYQLPILYNVGISWQF